MRVTDKMFYDSVSASVMRASEQVYRAQERAQSGLRVSRASDDPARAARGFALDSGLRRLESMGRAASTARTEISTADTTLSEALNLVTRAMELGIQGANGHLNDSDRADIATELGELREGLRALANTKIGEVYLFSGKKTDTPAYDDTGAYRGDSGARVVEVAPGISVRANIPGADIFAAQGGGDVFGMLESMETALRSNDPARLRDRYADLEGVVDQIANARARVGSQMNMLDLGETMRDELGFALTESKSEAVEADHVQTMLDMLQAQQAMQAAMAEATRILGGLQSLPSVG